MKPTIYKIDTFISETYDGSPAYVIPLDSWLPDVDLLNIAKDNAVPETAFFIYNENKIQLRWFTPEIEIDLCGHATLATAYVIFSILGYKSKNIIFETMSGDLKVSIIDDIYYLNFPSRPAKLATLPKQISMSLNIQPIEVYKSRDYMLIYNGEEEIRDIVVNPEILDQISLGYGGVIVTAHSTKVDFVSRYFTPQASILEDPVTGSAHCSLIPYWSNRLNKKVLEGHQISSRGGRLLCEDLSTRVVIGGQARRFL